MSSDDLFSEIKRSLLEKSSALSISSETEGEVLVRFREIQSFVQLIRNAQDVNLQCR